THDIFSYNGMNTVSGITPTRDRLENPREGCFQGLRVFRYPIAVTDSNGQVLQVRRRTNDEMKQFGFSTEQYDMVREITRQQCITIGRLTVESFHDFIRLRMKRVDSVAPLAFMENYADELLDAYIFRAQFVQDSWTDVCDHGSITYPEERSKENIFQALGRWETWSSPSSDIDRRNKYFYLADWLEYVIRLFRVIPGFVDLAGLEKYGIQSQGALAKALIAEKQRIFSERSMAYTNSKGKQLRLTLGDIEERLYDLSFDPNHPPELRWGAPIDSEERASAPNTVTPVPTGEKIDMEDAYRWQRYYRCIGTRETDMSCLQGMFTTGFVIRDKLDRQLSKWIDVVENITPGIGSNMEATSSAPILSQPSLPASEKLPAVPVAAKPVIQIEKEIHRPRRGISKKLLPPKRALPMRRPVRARNAH
ncbi:MAG: hypothetical protein KAH38_03185, partial [Candidatus Hydrogenedentes bacterium]|nr:hypothetical protein [Candidatus Hydrogenedentota bacterium]